MIYRCIIGSQAYGLAGEASDIDRRGIYLPPAELHWSLFSVPEQLENEATQEASWELQKFLTLALKANPNVLECLYSPLVEKATPLAEELVAIRPSFLSRLVLPDTMPITTWVSRRRNGSCFKRLTCRMLSLCFTFRCTAHWHPLDVHWESGGESGATE